MKANSLIFVDTNILLDFYRSKNEKGLSLLHHLDAIHNDIISSYQVEMEFKKNRQRVIYQSLDLLKNPPNFQPPAFIFEARPTRILNKSFANINTRMESLRARIKNILKKPKKFDPVYRCAHRIFSDSTKFNLTRDKQERFKIRNLARKRFCLGYPPRKKEDTAIGDSVNWEWIVQCAIKSSRNIVLVSRDSDYGITFDGESYVNDWLLEEFRARVSLKRTLTLVDRLSTALKQINVKVTKQEERDEAETIWGPSQEKEIAELNKRFKKLNELWLLAHSKGEFDSPSDS